MPRWTHVAGSVALAALLFGCGGNGGDAAPPTTAAPASTAPEPTTAAGRESFDASAVPGFPIPMRLLLDDAWRAQEGAPGTIDVVHTGSPAEDTSQWWGAQIAVIDEASVHDPATASVTDRPPTRADYVPFPGDYLAYLTALPSVLVEAGPDAVVVGGMPGRRIVVETPAMHPLLWMKDDTAPYGGGPTGMDPPMKRQITLVDVGGRQLLVEYDDASSTFEERLPQVEKLLATIELPG